MLGRYLYARRRWAKQAVAAVARRLPPRAARPLRALAERVAFRVIPQYQGDTLPPMFLYWAQRHVAPLLRPLGVESPEDLVWQQAVRACGRRPDGAEIVSLGSGACALEVRLAMRLRDAGHACRVRCVDFNPALLARGQALARREGVDDRMLFDVLDCNETFVLPRHDVIVVNQFLHHVEQVGEFCASMQRCLAPDGVIVASDLVGRNGHALWPDTDRIVQAHWQRLPPAKTYDRYFARRTTHYRSVDHAAYSNEGIRAQDVVAHLAGAFAFESFITFGAAIIPFVERRVGFNFSVDDAEDRAFIDALADLDARNIAARLYPAVNMIAVLRHLDRVSAPHFDPVSPAEHVALTHAQARIATTH